MKIILLLLSLIISFNAHAVNYYKEDQSREHLIILKAQERIRWLEEQIFYLNHKIETRQATRYEVALRDKYMKELQYLKNKFQ